MSEHYVSVADVMLEVMDFDFDVFSSFRIPFVIDHIDCAEVVDVDRCRWHGS